MLNVKIMYQNALRTLHMHDMENWFRQTFVSHRIYIFKWPVKWPFENIKERFIKQKDNNKCVPSPLFIPYLQF